MRLIPSEDFFYREHYDFRTKFGLRPRISDNFCPVHKVLKNHDLGKRHKIWEKLHCPQFFLAGKPMPIIDVCTKAPPDEVKAQPERHVDGERDRQHCFGLKLHVLFCCVLKKLNLRRSSLLDSQTVLNFNYISQ